MVDAGNMQEMNTDKEILQQYYAARVSVMDAVYDKPERQADLALLHTRVADALRGHKVLEIACGTGYWTAHYAAGAASVLATDMNTEALAIAHARNLPEGKVHWAAADAFDLTPVATPGQFTACFAGFWWSHIKREQQGAYLDHLRATLGKDALLVLIDNTYVEGSSTVIARTDLEGNTHQIRQLPDGSRMEVIKNFPTDSALRKKMGAAVRDIRIERLQHYWMLTCRLK
jgi:SAM-dependent methyltransferase